MSTLIEYEDEPTVFFNDGAAVYVRDELRIAGPQTA
jgi:hypothetical protein